MSSRNTAWDAHNQLLDHLVDITHKIAFWQAQEQHALVALLAEPAPLLKLDEGDQLRWLAHEVGAALHLHSSTAGDRIADAARLVRELPHTLKLLEMGHLTIRHARAALDAFVGLPPEQIARLEDEVLPEAVGLSVSEFTARLDRAVHQLAPKLIEDRHQQELDERGVWAKGTRNGTLSLRARGLDPVAGAALMNTLNAISDSYAAADRDTPSENVNSGDTPVGRTADQRRADALLALAGEVTEAVPSKPPIGINVCVALSTLIGQDEQPGEIGGPGFAPGSPITAAQARLLAFDPTSTWRRLITDPLGRLIDYGRTKYRPPVALADFIAARDRTCRGLHCNRQAESCDIDHHFDWVLGGHTAEYNLGPICRGDHVTKHASDWKVARLDNGDHKWTSPIGRTYVKRASTYPIDHTTTEVIIDPTPPF